MRDRHVKRFAAAYRATGGQDVVRGVSVEVAAEAMACMVEQCCYVWFAQEADCNNPVSMAEAITVTSEAWYATMFSGLKP